MWGPQNGTCSRHLSGAWNCVVAPSLLGKYLHPYHSLSWAGTAQSVQRLATGWTVRGSNPGGGEIFRTWKVLKCGAGEGWRRSVGPIM